MSKIPYNITNDSITVVINNLPTTVNRGAPNFLGLRETLLAGDWDRAKDHLEIGRSLAQWAKGRFTVAGDTVYFDGEVLPAALNRRISEMASNGDSPNSLFNFWERLQRNPSARSVSQLWNFLELVGIPLTPTGHFLAYKGVRSDFKDVHSGTILNSPGEIVRVPRNKVSDDPAEPCHFGLHVGSLEYASDFGPQVVICQIDPEHVVCVPNDHSFQKMRVCEYTVIGLHGGGHMSSTVIDDDDWNGDDEFSDSDDMGDDDFRDDSSDDDADFPPPVKTFFLNEQHELPVKEWKPVKSPLTKLPKWARELNEMTDSELAEQTLEVLRRYATKVLKIVGASKIPGGKHALLDAIAKARA